MRLLLILALLAATAAPASAAGPRLQLEIDGARKGDRVGSVAADAGDVNGDGLPDLLIGEQHARPHGTRSGSVFVVFGRRAKARVELGRLGSRGFRIDGAEPEARAGFAVAAAGDVNGDGLGDVIVGATGGVSGIDTVHDGAAFVVYGKRGNANVDLADLGSAGFRISGEPDGQLGFAVDGAGDVNGDGLGDVIVGDPSGGNGTAYVVFGSRTSADVSVGALGERGFLLDGAGFSVAGAGDVNGDGRADVVVTAGDADTTYVVFGETSTEPVDLAALGARGFRIAGTGKPDAEAVFVAAAGDVNADGRPDVILGAPNAFDDAGAAYVVFGSASTEPVRLARLGRRGFRIRGARGTRAGTAVDGAGDINRDGRADVLVGASGARGRDRGAAYVVFGSGSRADVDLPRLGRAGLPLPGPAPSARAGWSVAGVANADGKGHDGALVGAPYLKRTVGAAFLWRP